MRRVFCASLLVATLACGGGEGGGPTAPTPSIPNVSGSYSGTSVITLPEISMQASCPTSTSVTQSGSTVNIAPLILRGECGGVSIPLGQGSIDATGALVGGSTSGTYADPSCGTYSYTASGGFFGRELRIAMSATSRTCLNFNFTATLTR